MAEWQGEPFMEPWDDEDWPDPPIGEDNYDWTVVRNWLYILLIGDIPHRELDDPPDVWESTDEGEDRVGIIEELSPPDKTEINQVAI